MRFVLPAGKMLPERAVDGPITMHCIEGAIEVVAHGNRQTMRTDDPTYLVGKAPHAPRVTKDAPVLVAIVVQKPST